MILITGAAGHVGNVLIRHLLDKGYSGLRAMILPGEDRTPLAGLDVEIVEADITRPETLTPAFAGAKKVLHLASLVSIGDAQEDVIERVNVEGTRNVIAASKAAGVERLLYVSSIHAFAKPQGPRLDETVGLAPQSAPPYDRTKSAATQLVLDAAREMDTVVAAPSGVFGPYDFKRSEVGSQYREWIARPFTLMLPGGYDFVDVRDVAEGLRLVLEKGRRGEIYLLGNEWAEMGGMAREVMNKVHGRAQIVTIPVGVARVLAQLALSDSKRRGVRPVLTPYALETLQAPYRLDSGKARRELGYSPRPLRQTVHDTVEWWQANPNAGGGRRG